MAYRLAKYVVMACCFSSWNFLSSFAAFFRAALFCGGLALPPFSQLPLLHDFLLYRQDTFIRVRRGERVRGRVPGYMLYCLNKDVHVVFDVLCRFSGTFRVSVSRIRFRNVAQFVSC